MAAAATTTPRSSTASITKPATSAAPTLGPPLEPDTVRCAGTTDADDAGGTLGGYQRWSDASHQPSAGGETDSNHVPSSA